MALSPSFAQLSPDSEYPARNLKLTTRQCLHLLGNLCLAGSVFLLFFIAIEARHGFVAPLAIHSLASRTKHPETCSHRVYQLEAESEANPFGSRSKLTAPANLLASPKQGGGGLDAHRRHQGAKLNAAQFTTCTGSAPTFSGNKSSCRRMPSERLAQSERTARSGRGGLPTARS